MKEYDYTPGPWHVSNEGKLVIRDDEWFAPVATAGYNTNGEEIATANLIAAAPDLLEALQNMVAAYESEASYDNPSLLASRAAISKALGE